MNNNAKNPRKIKQPMNRKNKSAFHLLTPDTVINLAEKAAGSSFSNLYRPYNSYINRVFELEQMDGTRRIIKFYRPGRWSSEAILQEHEFLLELSLHQIPVIAPLQLVHGSTLGECKGIFFALFPKCGGRCLDEYTDDQWQELGRLLGRIHNIGAMHGAGSRVFLGPDTSTRCQVDSILKSGLVPNGVQEEFCRIVEEIIGEINPLFCETEMIRLHGDCHFANIIYRPQESFSLIDFDDMVIGPPVQDFWMLLPGLLDESFIEADLFLEGYETFRQFDRRTLRLIEPLRAMRYIHYLSWCIHQVVEDGETRVMDDFGTPGYWDREIKDLQDQLVRIRKPWKSMGNA